VNSQHSMITKFKLEGMYEKTVYHFVSLFHDASLQNNILTVY